MTASSPAPMVDVDLDAVCANYRFLKASVAPAECAAVVKCDGYGLGAVQIARALANEGCGAFFVTYAEEGAALRQAGVAGPIYVFNGPDAASLALFRDAGLTPVLNSLDQARLWLNAAPGAGAALHVDTGMNRLGAPAAEVRALASLQGLRIDLVMSHLACPSLADESKNERQRAAFEEEAAFFPGARRSLAASGGALMDPRYHYDLVRPGLALYGASPFDRPDTRLKTVASLAAPVLQIREAPPGETVGYGATFSVTRPSRLATVALGYGDGYPRAASNRARAFLGGALCPIAGRVSMDLSVLDVTDAPLTIHVGDLAEFFGARLPVEDAAAAAGTLAYELLTSLGPRVARRYWRHGRPLSAGDTR
ncbi:MAG: alanine racemase [Parvularculaceae bacterium]